MDRRRRNGGLLLMDLFVIVAFLIVVTAGVGLIPNASMGGELGHTIIQYAVIYGGIVAGISWDSYCISRDEPLRLHIILPTDR